MYIQFVMLKTPIQSLIHILGFNVHINKLMITNQIG